MLAGYPTTRRGGRQGVVCFVEVPPELLVTVFPSGAP